MMPPFKGSDDLQNLIWLIRNPSEAEKKLKAMAKALIDASADKLAELEATKATIESELADLKNETEVARGQADALTDEAKDYVESMYAKLDTTQSEFSAHKKQFEKWVKDQEVYITKKCQKLEVDNQKLAVAQAKLAKQTAAFDVKEKKIQTIISKFEDMGVKI